MGTYGQVVRSFFVYFYLTGCIERLSFLLGGITNGNDMMAAYARSTKHFPVATTKIGCAIADVGDRTQRYEQGQVAYTLKFVWQLVRAWLSSGK